MANDHEPPPTADLDQTEDLPDPARAGGGWRTAAIVGAIIVAIIAALVVGLSLTGGAPPSALPSSGPSAAASDTTPSSSAPDEAVPTEAAPPVEPTPDMTPVDQPPAAEPVPISDPAEIAPALTARISAIEAVDGEAQGPGEVAAPSIRVTVEIDNATTEAAALDTAVVTAYYGSDSTPAAELREPGGRAFPASVAAGESADAVYVFSVPPDERDAVTILVDYSLDVAPLQFHGEVPR
ncbi:hypothetical protein [Agromyces salentinus]|uniref:DUF4352 domain-containing protein n=1 Tax=Agromyces salentinus TaxID=269421 RepID=A0ABN2MPJ6_9MICO|nr:hypothetical protein [Agromyces salentinus]